MNQLKPIREQISYKQHENYLRGLRDQLCLKHRMNKSDLMKHLIQQEYRLLTQVPEGDLKQ
jgi:hypothetical protein